MSVISIVLIILVGFILFFIEFFIIPGISVAGIAGFLFIGGGIFCGYYFHDQTTGNLILIGTGISMFIMFILFLKLKTWKRVGLASAIESKVGVLDETEVKIGDEGTTVSKLSPIGKASIKGKLYEVRSYGSYIDQNITVMVSAIDGNKIFVEPKI